MDDSTTVKDLISRIGEFIDERNWNPFHDPKNLSMSISIEAAELMELFQWIDNTNSLDLCSDPTLIAQVREEVADVIIYALSMCRVLKIDVSSSILDKIEKNRKKYPVGKCTFRK